MYNQPTAEYSGQRGAHVPVGVGVGAAVIVVVAHAIGAL